MKSTCWDTRTTDSIIKSGQKDTEASIQTFCFGILPRYQELELYLNENVIDFIALNERFLCK